LLPPLPPVAPAPPDPPVAPVPPVGEESSSPQFTSATAAPTTNNMPIVTEAVLIEFLLHMNEDQRKPRD
jgi:hypothetical protein